MSSDPTFIPDATGAGGGLPESAIPSAGADKRQPDSSEAIDSVLRDLLENKK